MHRTNTPRTKCTKCYERTANTLLCQQCFEVMDRVERGKMITNHPIRTKNTRWG